MVSRLLDILGSRYENIDFLKKIRKSLTRSLVALLCALPLWVQAQTPLPPDLVCASSYFEDRIELYWSPVSGASAYNVYYSESFNRLVYFEIRVG